jgi:hypothetical protein
MNKQAFIKRDKLEIKYENIVLNLVSGHKRLALKQKEKKRIQKITKKKKKKKKKSATRSRN